MSGHSDQTTCPECDGKNLIIYTDNKPFDMVSGTCQDCGFYYYTDTKQLTLEELNAERKSRDLRPLKKLRKKKRRV